MSRGYRLYFAAVFGWLILAGATERDHENWHQGDKRSNYHQGNPPPPIIKPLLISNPSKSGDDGCQGAYDESRSCNALAANAAIDQARYAFWQTIAAWIIGTGTLVAAVLAARWAKKAAEETKRSADAADIGIRPWVDFEIEVREQSFTEDCMDISIWVNMKNMGKTAATHTKVDFAIIQGLDWAPKIDAFFDSDPVYADQKSDVTMLPNGQAKLPVRLLLRREHWEPETAFHGELLVISPVFRLTYLWGKNTGSTCRAFSVQAIFLGQVQLCSIAVPQIGKIPFSVVVSPGNASNIR